MTALEALRERSSAEHLLRAAIALSLLYPPLAALGDPFSWIGYIPVWVLAIAPVSAETLLHAFGLFEVALALWLFFSVRVRVPALIAAAVLLFITATNPAQFPVLFRDLALALAALALAFLPHSRS